MQFSLDVRHELSRILPDRRCCRLAEMSAILRGAGSLVVSGSGGLFLVIALNDAAVARKMVRLIKGALGVEPEIAAEKSPTGRRIRRYVIRIAVEAGMRTMLRRLGIEKQISGSRPLIKSGLLRNKCCRRAYLRGVFLACGYVADPERGYHLEMTIFSDRYAEEIRALLASLDLEAGSSVRGGLHVVYLKGSEAIFELLAMMGAHNSALRLQSVRVDRSIRNDVNRLVNCDTGNVSRIVESAMRQVEAIKLIQKHIGLGKLKPALKEIAQLRLMYPESSLNELVELLDRKISKSGVEHRLRRILQLAEKLKHDATGHSEVGEAGDAGASMDCGSRP